MRYVVGYIEKKLTDNWAGVCTTHKLFTGWTKCRQISNVTLSGQIWSRVEAYRAGSTRGGRRACYCGPGKGSGYQAAQGEEKRDIDDGWAMHRYFENDK